MLLLWLIVVIMIVVLWKIFKAEQFASKQEKSWAIYNWFQQNKNPEFVKYKRELPQSDIVEYDRAYALQQNNKLTQGTVLASLMGEDTVKK